MLIGLLTREDKAENGSVKILAQKRGAFYTPVKTNPLCRQRQRG
jgi:hypothetical protein